MAIPVIIKTLEIFDHDDHGVGGIQQIVGQGIGGFNGVDDVLNGVLHGFYFLSLSTL